MRISTVQFQQVSLQSMLEHQAKLSKTQQQLATGRRVLTPADDPAAAARALDLTKSIASLEQFQKNGDRALTRLNMEDTVLDQAGDVLIRLTTLAMQAQNDTNSAQERSFIGNEVRELHLAMMQLANSTDGAGEYLFAGYKTKTKPFEMVDGAVQYEGDNGARKVQVGPSRDITITHSGNQVFMDVPDGEGGTRSVFASIEAMLGALQPEEGEVVDVHAVLGQVMDDFERGLENLLEARSRVGGRINAVEAEMEGSRASLIELKSALSDVEDLDYAEGVTRLSLELAGLDAAQQSYMKIQGLSLFNYL